MTPAKQDNRAATRASTAGEVNMFHVKRTPKNELRRTIVTVKVGQEDAQRTFSTHRELLCFYSPFFRSMMDGNWEESKTNIINLPADDPNVYEVFDNWLYGINLGLESTQTKDVSLIMGLWIFGDKVQAPGFQNAAIEALRSAAIEPPRIFRLKDIQTAFENTGEGSALRKLIVDLYVWEGPLTGLMPRLQHDGYPPAFITELFEGYVDAFPRPSTQTVKNKRPYAVNAQQYYAQYQGTSVARDAAADTAET
ncbi:MAG: hypothetical protein Q9209_003897 [Squamulea sp. 1 TL-2023]